MRSVIRSTEGVLHCRLTVGANRGIASMKGGKVVRVVGVECRIRRILHRKIQI